MVNDPGVLGVEIIPYFLGSLETLHINFPSSGEDV